jgi:hypothetical protein
MPGANRHRAPTATQLFERVYRRQIKMEEVIRDLKAEVARLGARTEINAALANHCKRLLLEKATLLKVIEANRFMAAALPRRPVVSIEEMTTL